MCGLDVTRVLFVKRKHYYAVLLSMGIIHVQFMNGDHQRNCWLVKLLCCIVPKKDFTNAQ